METKICKKCGIPKLLKEYRINTHGKYPFTYKSCKTCINKQAFERDKVKPSYKLLHCKSRKTWASKNLDKLKIKRKRINKRREQRSVIQLSDGYIKKLIKNSLNYTDVNLGKRKRIKINDFKCSDIPTELIQIHKKAILFRREIEILSNNCITEETKICSKCKIEHSINNFEKRTLLPLKYRGVCKTCRK